jgi:hypothetical protein
MEVNSEEACHLPRDSVPLSDVRIVSGIFLPPASYGKSDLPSA